MEVELPSANASAKVTVLINNVPLRKPMDLFEGINVGQSTSPSFLKELASSSGR